MHRLLLLPALLLLTACSGDSTTSVTAGGNRIAVASVLLDGQPVNGQTVTGDGGQTMFRIELLQRDRLHVAAVEGCQVMLEGSGMGPGGWHRAGIRTCYDDGSNGDDVPGDGICHYLDADNAIGCGRATMPVGTYEYRFDCAFADGTTSAVTTTINRR